MDKRLMGVLIILYIATHLIGGWAIYHYVNNDIEEQYHMTEIYEVGGYYDNEATGRIIDRISFNSSNMKSPLILKFEWNFFNSSLTPAIYINFGILEDNIFLILNEIYSTYNGSFVIDAGIKNHTYGIQIITTTLAFLFFQITTGYYDYLVNIYQLVML